MNTIKFKTIGYIPLEVTKIGGKKIVKVYSTTIIKGKDALQECKKIIESSKVLKTTKEKLTIIGHALKLQELRNNVLFCAAEIRKTAKFKYAKRTYLRSIAYFRLHCAKIKLFKYVRAIEGKIERELNDFLVYSRLFRFTLRNLNIA